MITRYQIDKFKRNAWDILRSPRTVSVLKLGAAIVGVIHAIEEIRGAARLGKQSIGFRMDDHSDYED